jgi:hypothetical protein
MATDTVQYPTEDPDVKPWLDDKFAPMDTRTGGSDFLTGLVEDTATDEDKAAIAAAQAKLDAAQAHPFAPEPEAVLQPEVITNTPASTPVTAPQPVVTAPTAKEPEVYEYDDGSVVVIEDTPTGKKATLSIGEGSGAEVFYGKDESELLRQVLTAKLNATKQIRQQNKQLKLKVATQSAAPTPARARTRVRELTADEKFEIKNQLTSDPDAALTALIEKKTGMKLEDIVENARLGAQASQELYIDTEARAFVESHPEYLSTDTNYRMIIGYLAKAKLGVELTDANANQVMLELPKRGFFNRQTLAEAFDVLAQDGLLELQAVEEEVEPTPAPVPAAQPAPAPVAPVTAQPATPAPTPAPTGIPGAPRPRAASIGFGVRTSEASGAPTSEPSAAPTVEELESMSDKDINELMASVIRFKTRQSARR